MQACCKSNIMIMIHMLYILQPYHLGSISGDIRVILSMLVLPVVISKIKLYCEVKTYVLLQSVILSLHYCSLESNLTKLCMICF